MSIESKYIIADTVDLAKAQVPADFHILSPADKIVFVSSIPECLNAEKDGADAVIWISEDYDQLEELSSKKREYGWMLVSINIPVLLHISDIQQLNKLDNIKIQGFYSEDLSLLKETQKKVESLRSE